MPSLVTRIRESSIAGNSLFDCGGDGGTDSSPRNNNCHRRCQGGSDNDNGDGGDGDDVVVVSLFQYLREMWERAVQNLEFKTCGGKDLWLQKLWLLYCEPTRHYHTAVHLEEMFRYLSLVLEERGREQQQEEPSEEYEKEENDETQILIGDGDEQAIRLAVFFHDAIYNPQSETNEQDSAQLFQSFVRDLVADDSVVELQEKVIRFILATERHHVPSDDSVPLALFLDLDTAVLGKQWSAYFKYASLVRREYSFASRQMFCEKRAQILDNFLHRGPIFGTVLFREALEDRARSNLQQEIICLLNGRIPGESE